MASPTPFKWLIGLALWFGGTLPLVGFAAPTPISSSLNTLIQDAARRSSLDPQLVKAVIQVESNFKLKIESPKGALGLMQMMAPTANELEVHDRTHALNHLMGACEYLRKMINRYRGDLKLALAAYNAGPSAVDRYKGIPPFRETRQYVKKVLKIYKSQ